MDVSEIVDEDSFRHWLTALPQGGEAERDAAQRWAVLLAHRAAMRVLPIGLARASAEQAFELNNETVAFFRANEILSASIGKNSDGFITSGEILRNNAFAVRHVADVARRIAGLATDNAR